MTLAAVHRLLWMCAALGLVACGGETGKSSTESAREEAPVAPLPATAPIDETPETWEFPLLGNDNALPFLEKYFRENRERRVRLTTRHGSLSIKLYDDTPLHTANFLMMVKRNYFSGTEFTRIVPDFVVQGGNSERETDEIKRLLIGNYLIPAEIHDKYPHRKGALAMARSYEDNPDKKSSAYDFYLVVGRTFNEPQLMAMEREHNMVIPEWKRKIYRETGGAPHLDGQHTVFGQVVEGMEVLERMGRTPTDERNWPLESLIMEMEALP